MRIAVFVISTLFLVAAPAAPQSLDDACFRIHPVGTDWRATPTNPEPPNDPRPFAEYFSGGAQTFQLLPRPDVEPWTGMPSHVLALDSVFYNPRFEFSEWYLEGDSLTIWWTSGYDMHTAVFAPGAEGERPWTGRLTWRSDARLSPDPGEWSYLVELGRIACPTAQPRIPN
jgi:hypothetical protein